jgi:hypothetical protein
MMQPEAGPARHILRRKLGRAAHGSASSIFGARLADASPPCGSALGFAH